LNGVIGYFSVTTQNVSGLYVTGFAQDMSFSVPSWKIKSVFDSWVFKIIVRRRTTISSQYHAWRRLLYGYGSEFWVETSEKSWLLWAECKIRFV